MNDDYLARRRKAAELRAQRTAQRAREAQNEQEGPMEANQITFDFINRRVRTVSSPPFQAHSLTSYEAAEEIKPAAHKLRAQVLDYIRDHGPVTDEQISTGTGLAGNTARPRRLELYNAGLIRKAGKSHTTSGRSAYAWEAI